MTPPRLKLFVPLMDADESPVRELYMEPALHDWCYQKDASRGRDYKPNVRAFLGRFVKGGFVDSDYLKTWRSSIFEFRFQGEPRAPRRPHRDNTRIFGGFIRPDTFIAYHPPRLRSQFRPDGSLEWDDVIDAALDKFRAMFGQDPVKAPPLSNCLTSNFREGRA